MTEKLRAEQITKRYHNVVALQPTTLSMRDGEFLTLLGPSGSGKTTLLSLIAGLTEPTGGDIWIDGRRVTDESSAKRGLGMVFQNYALFPHLSIYENIAFPLRMRRMGAPQIDAAVRRVLELVHLPHVAERLPRELSGGQQQRIALARCIVYEPSIILMDEPLGALDKNLREHMQTEIKRLHVELGITILYVTHDQEEALSMSDRICLMNNARVEQIGTPADLYFKPASVFAAGFLGESNIAPAKVLSTGTETLLGSPDGSTIRVATGAGRRAEEEVNWMVRPERLKLIRDGETHENIRRGQLLGVVFAGGFTKINVRLDDGTILLAKELTSAGPLPERGQTVTLGWSAADAIVLPPGT
ncbi:ABC transporter ATP-binding protein [Bosea sp. AS-1]|jgi:putative spermidine/putrescine transport system ATP-binding protein|uniref:ABC transporter ATP-binding protein n=1 Tax=Bosea sp. AS-1 TaxID=2015316 RepID=UPI000B783888|nr:ABC transporter ATP-binding protein [Bosea sp. AS-1]